MKIAEAFTILKKLDPPTIDAKIIDWNNKEVDMWFHFGSSYVRAEEYMAHQSMYPRIEFLKGVIFS